MSLKTRARRVFTRSLKKMGLIDVGLYLPRWRIEKYWTEDYENGGKPFEIRETEGNLLLNEGITELHLLLTGGTATAYSQANTYLGVGDSNTAASASQTGLQAAVNKVYVQCEVGYPTYAAQVSTWRAIYGNGVGEFAWNEFTVCNGSSDSGDNLNRLVSVEGTKGAGQTWTLDLQITWS